LLSIFSPSKSIPATTAARVQRYALFLSGFQYDIQYNSTKKHTNVDALSRLPLQSQQPDVVDEDDVFYTSQLEQLPVSSAQIKRETQRESTLSRVLENVQNGWTCDSKNTLLKAYYSLRGELSIHRGCLMWGIRVVIPIKLRKHVLDLLHASHPGVVKMKALARSYVWWPGIDNDIEILVKQCHGCQMQQNAPHKSNLHPWEWPSSPWERVHVDFAGPFLNRMFLIVVDAHSKWPECILMKCTTAEKTVEELRTIFARNGLPKQLVSDNGSQFVSEVFQKFMRENGIFHIKSAPYKPSTNGQAERFVATFKSSMRAMCNETDDINLKLNCFLLRYRNTPHTTTGETPAKLFMGRTLRTKLDLLKPDTQKQVSDSQMKLAFSNDRKLREFEIGETVLARDYRSKDKWIRGTIASREGPLMYKIDVGYGILWRRHADQLRNSEIVQSPKEIVRSPEFHDNVVPTSFSHDIIQPNNDPNVISKQIPLEISERQDKPQSTPIVINDKQTEISSSNGRRYPQRARKPPDRFTL
jgi:hypothetical protein